MRNLRDKYFDFEIENYFKLKTNTEKLFVVLDWNDILNIDHIGERLFHDYGLHITYMSQIDRSFQTALCRCLFDNEDDMDSITSTLNVEKDRSAKQRYR